MHIQFPHYACQQIQTMLNVPWDNEYFMLNITSSNLIICTNTRTWDYNRWTQSAFMPHSSYKGAYSLIDNYWWEYFIVLQYVSYCYFGIVPKPLMGGGDFRPIILETSILRYELKGMARTSPDVSRVVLGPRTQCFPCEASQQKWGQKSKYKTHKRRWSFEFVTIRFVSKKQAVSNKRMSKSNEKWPSYAH